MRITPSKGEVTGSIFGITRGVFWLLILMLTVGGVGTGVWMVKPYWLGLERQAYVASHQYVEAQRAAMITIHTQIIGIDPQLVRSDLSAQLKQALVTQRSALIARLRELAVKVPSDAVPPSVIRLLATN